MFSSSFSSRFRSALLVGASAAFLPLLAGCGMGVADATGSHSGEGSTSMGGVAFGGPNPIVGATITLYVTSTGAGSTYGSAATAVTSTTTLGDGSFNFTLPAGTVCPAGEYAYIAGYGGDTGANATTGLTNTTTLLMAPIGLCDSNYSVAGGVSTYTGHSLWMNELTTAVSAYALGNFMKLVPNAVTSVVDVNVGAPQNNRGTASPAIAASSTPASAAGLAHAFTNALALVNNQTGVPRSFTNGGSSTTTGGIVPVAEIYLLGNVLQACVNSTGLITGVGAVTTTATANDGSGCGRLFSMTTPPTAGAATPSNTLQAMINLAKYPNPSVNTWNTGCTAASGGLTTATTCLFNIATPQAAYAANELAGAPADWTLAVVYLGNGTTPANGFGGQTSGCTGTCPGLAYPFYVTLDYKDNVYVLNYSASTTTFINIIGIGNDGSKLFSSSEDTTANHLTMTSIGTDTAGHVFGVTPNGTSNNEVVLVYSTTDGSLTTTVSTSTSQFGVNAAYTLADPVNNINVISNQNGISVRKLAYTAGSPPTYAFSTLSNSATSGAGTIQVSYGTNLDLLFVTGPTTSPFVYAMSNTATYSKSTPAAATYGVNSIASVALTGNTSNAYGIGGLSNGNAVAISSAGATPIIKSGTSSSSLSAGTPVTLPFVNVTTNVLYDRGTAVDGLNTVFAIDGANGTYGTGTTVYDATNGLALGVYKGCYVLTATKTCGFVNNNSSGTGPAAIQSPRAIAIDSSGDVWIASGASANLTEFVGVAAPTWPGRSMGLQGEPQ